MTNQTREKEVFYSTLNYAETLHSIFDKNPKTLKRVALLSAQLYLSEKYQDYGVFWEIVDSNQLVFKTKNLRMEVYVELIFNESDLPFWKIKITNQFGEYQYTARPYEHFENAFPAAYTYTLMNTTYRAKSQNS